ncbi:MAG TPA: VOC family protein [Bryobacteraceae bacterium]|jgi:predicted lactoylglutathione lyase|nr:VOC family protein [Bryobacteraceae bacterium]
MKSEFPPAVPEIPVSDVNKAADYYHHKLGFHLDWVGEDGRIAGISQGQCRMFLTNPAFRGGSPTETTPPFGNVPPVLIWLNLNSKAEVDDLYQLWKNNQARIICEPGDRPWKLHEFTAADLDGNQFRVFYDFRGDA